MENSLKKAFHTRLKYSFLVLTINHAISSIILLHLCSCAVSNRILHYPSSSTFFWVFVAMTKGNIRIIMNDSRGVDLPMQSCNVSCSCNFCRSACRSAKVTVDTRPTISIGSISLTYLQFTVSVVYLVRVLFRRFFFFLSFPLPFSLLVDSLPLC